MPIEQLTDDHLVQRCAVCAASHTVAPTALVAGVAAPQAGIADPRVVALPACASCGAQEFLVRSLATDPEPAVPGSYGHLHRLLVDHLHAQLVRRGQVPKEIDKAPAPPGKLVDEATLNRWFPGGLELPAPAASEPGGAA